jgi:hypothetical protein
MKPKRYILVRIEGSDEPGDETEPDFDVFPMSIEFYGEFKVVATVTIGPEEEE